MPVKKIKRDTVPENFRVRMTPLKQTEEWSDVQAILAAGLKKAEAVEVTLNPATLTNIKIKNPVQSFRRMIAAKVKELGLEYDVWQHGGKSGTTIYIVGR